MDRQIFFLLKQVVWLFSGLLVACQAGRESHNMFDAGLGDDEVKVIRLRVDTACRGMDVRLIAKDKLIVSYRDNTYNYAIYRINGDSLKYLGSFLLMGNGPNEINSPRLKYDPHRDRLCAYGPVNFENKLFYIPFADYKSVFTPSLWETGALPHLPARGNMEFINDSTFLTICGNKENKLFSLSYKGRDKYFKCLDFSYPELNEELVSGVNKSILFEGNLKKQPDSDSYLYSSEKSKYSFLFNLRNDSIVNIRYLSNVLPNIKVTSSGRDYSRDGATEDGCFFVDVTKSYIYMGYNNMTLEQLRNGTPFKEKYPITYFDRINVFDWHGKFIRRLVLDTPVMYFAVTPDDKIIYASTYGFPDEVNVTDEIVRIDLSDF